MERKPDANADADRKIPYGTWIWPPEGFSGAVFNPKK
jgi:hypothetical protein